MSHKSTLHLACTMSCGSINASSATIALGLTLSWGPTSAETKHVSNNHHASFVQKLWNLKKIDKGIARTKQWHFYLWKTRLKLRSRFYKAVLLQCVRWVIYTQTLRNFLTVYVCQKLRKSDVTYQSYERRQNGPFLLRHSTVSKHNILTPHNTAKARH